MNKIISAQSILKKKGYVQNKFDTGGFMQAVGKYFLANSVESKLLLVPFRFLDINRTQEINGKEEHNPFNISVEDETHGFKDESVISTTAGFEGWPQWAVELQQTDFEQFLAEGRLGITVPRIIVDKPYFENAAASLRLMGGFVVEKVTKKRHKFYNVTLI